MAISVASAHRTVLTCSRAALLALALGLAAPGAQAANPGDWWVYVANDYPDDIRDLLKQGADPNVRYKNGQPALMRAVVDGAWKVFDVLAADKRTDVNAENPAGETPLMYLAIVGQTDRAKSSSRAAPRSTAWAGRRCITRPPRVRWRWRACCWRSTPCPTRPRPTARRR